MAGVTSGSGSAVPITFLGTIGTFGTAGAVAVYWRRALYGRMASRIYLAWCAAAIILPITAGYLFDLTRGYGSAILIAGAGNGLGILVALGLPHQNVPRAGDDHLADSTRAAKGITGV